MLLYFESRGHSLNRLLKDYDLGTGLGVHAVLLFQPPTCFREPQFDARRDDSAEGSAELVLSALDGKYCCRGDGSNCPAGHV